MSGEYRRETKKHPARIDHTDGQSSSGYVLVPVGSDFVRTLTQVESFLPFELESGEMAYVNLSGIKRVVPLAKPSGETDSDDAWRSEEAEKAHARREAENGYRSADNGAGKQNADQKDDKPGKDEKPQAEKAPSPFVTDEHLDALDVLGIDATASKADLQSAYRKLVKLYHPDRLRGLGVSKKKIDYAAERLTEINEAYRMLIRIAPAA